MPQKLTLARFSEIQGQVLSFDWDDNGYVHGRYMLPRYNDDWGTSVNEDQFYTNDLELWAAPDHATRLERMNAYLQTEDYMRIGPLPGFLDLVRRLRRNGNELHVNTSRPAFMREATAEVVARHCPGIFTSIQHVPEGQEKLDVCRRIGAVVHSDDLGAHIASVTSGDVFGLHYGDYAWGNRGLGQTRPNVARVRSWVDTMPHVLVPVPE